MSSPVRRELEEYVAGRGEAARVVTAVMDAYYRDGGRGTGEALRPVLDVIERAAPGVVELAAAGDTPGFRVRLAERPFPNQYANELRTAAEAALRDWSPAVDVTPAALTVPGPPSPPQPPPPPTPARTAVAPPAPGLLQRVLGAIRRFFGG